MTKINLTYTPCQTVYVVEYNNKIKKYELSEQTIRHVDICNGCIRYYTAKTWNKDDICIAEYWTGLVTVSRRKFLNHNPECIDGDVFSSETAAIAYLNKKNNI